MKHTKTLARVSAVFATLAMLVAAPAHAQQIGQQLGFVAKDANLRAGPSGDFPVVAVLGSGVAITVEGCLGDFRWCDVSVGTHRGWLNAANIVYPYQGAYVPMLNYGAAIGIGVIGFSVGSYWDDYYRFRPWYPQRQHWIDRPYPGYFGHPGHPIYPAFPGQSVFRPGFHAPHPPLAVIPVPRPPHRHGPKIDHRPPQVHNPYPGHPPGVQAQPMSPRPHHGMRRTEGQRPGHGQNHGGGRHP